MCIILCSLQHCSVVWSPAANMSYLLCLLDSELMVIFILQKKSITFCSRVITHTSCHTVSTRTPCRSNKLSDDWALHSLLPRTFLALTLPTMQRGGQRFVQRFGYVVALVANMACCRYPVSWMLFDFTLFNILNIVAFSQSRPMGCVTWGNLSGTFWGSLLCTTFFTYAAVDLHHKHLNRLYRVILL